MCVGGASVCMMEWLCGWGGGGYLKSLRLSSPDSQEADYNEWDPPH